MNRIELIKKYNKEKRQLAVRLKRNYSKSRVLVKDFAKFCELEKEIQIQEAYLKHGQ